MDKVIDKANELSKEILNTPEVKEYLKLKELIEKDKELGKDGTVWLAPCEEDRTKKYASNVVEIMVE